MQQFLSEILKCLFTNDINLKTASFDVLYVILEQGLVHPLKVKKKKKIIIFSIYIIIYTYLLHLYIHMNLYIIEYIYIYNHNLLFIKVYSICCSI